jgi:two-component system, OmpR family, response regulator CpxR
MSKKNTILAAATQSFPQKGFKETQIYHTSKRVKKLNFEVPSKILLVDDEKEFVQTLSERLQMRDMGTAFVYDGLSALELIDKDAPEVMIVDLKMPGIDGMEILERVKQTWPQIQVIVLTGHGSEQDKKKCTGLGAFAYLQKPVDINLLSKTLKEAHENITANE